MTTAEEINLLITRLGVLFWQLDQRQDATIDSYEQQLNSLIWENLNHASVSTDLLRPSETHCTPAYLANHVCPII